MHRFQRLHASQESVRRWRHRRGIPHCYSCDGTRRKAGSVSGNQCRRDWPRQPSYAGRRRGFRSKRYALLLRALLWVEVLLDVHPALIIIFLQRRRSQCMTRRLDDVTCLEHESHRISDLVRLAGIAAARLLKGRAVRTVTGHAIVQTGAAGTKAFRLGVVFAMNQAHELTRDIAVEPGWTESMFGGKPARRKDHEVQRIHTRRIALRLQHQEDGWIGMVIADRADGVEVTQIVLVRRVVTVPRHHVQRRMADLRLPQVAAEFGNQTEVAFTIFIPCLWREK